MLRGYGVSRSILKELIQNAEDSGATRMDILHVSGDPAAAHPLFRGPGLLVVNDGTFSPENRLAIRQINLGTKGTEERAIGRFGKGLKSVFAWCEAFFIIARTNPAQGWPAPNYILDFFNPWHGWLHTNWDEAFAQGGGTYLTLAREHLARIYPDDQPWLAFWFPLRCASHTRDGDDTESFHDSYPGEDSRFLHHLATELRMLAPSLVSLRSLTQIRISLASGNGEPSLVWNFPQPEKRVPLRMRNPASRQSAVKPSCGIKPKHRFFIPALRAGWQTMSSPISNLVPNGRAWFSALVTAAGPIAR
ncbi:MAG: hypothetical protein QM813_17600 [Verrucomicrobiota bacterium]